MPGHLIPHGRAGITRDSAAFAAKFHPVPANVPCMSAAVPAARTSRRRRAVQDAFQRAAFLDGRCGTPWSYTGGLARKPDPRGDDQKEAVPWLAGAAPGKAQAAGFRILSDIFGHVQGHLYLLSNGTISSGIDQLCKQKNRVAPHELMIFAIPRRG